MTIVGAVTDNTSANKKAWATLKKEYPMKFFHGCASHGLHLIVKDIFDIYKRWFSFWIPCKVYISIQKIVSPCKAARASKTSAIDAASPNALVDKLQCMSS
jgi:Protein of unknown function (DUF 659)